MATSRGTPVGTMLENGYQSLVALQDSATISFWEKTVTIPPMDGGEKIPITTMHNTLLKTYAPQALYEMGDGAINVAYDPIILNTLKTQINSQQLITWHLPDTSNWDIFGYLRSFAPAALANGTHPEATAVIVATGVDPDDSSETAPVYNAPAP